VDETLHDRAPGWHEAAHDAGNYPASAEVQPRSGARVVFCTWCKTVTIFPGKDDDYLYVAVAYGARIARLNGQPITIQDGICEGCRAEKFPETVKRKDGQS
jgi:hypothetical protein